MKQIKDAAAKNNVTGAKLLAKQLVRIRGQQTKLQTAIASLRGVSASVVGPALNPLARLGFWQQCYAAARSALPLRTVPASRRAARPRPPHPLFVLCRPLRQPPPRWPAPCRRPPRRCRRWARRPICPRCRRTWRSSARVRPPPPPPLLPALLSVHRN